MQTLQQTPIHDRQVALGARMVPFAGWEMPVQYEGVIPEHRAVREDCGIFDVSHMGELDVEGPQARELLQSLLSNDLEKIEVGAAQYTLLTNEQGGIVDDLIVYRVEGGRYLLVVNASNREADYEWIRDRERPGSDVRDASDRYALLAVQGPAARDVLQTLTGANLAEVKYYWFTTGEVAGVRATISRTGYTGEDGFEVFVPPASAERVWDAVLNAGRTAGVVPAGLGARDTLRLEAAMRLYGNDMDETTTVVEADLGWIVGWKKAEFLGFDRLQQQRAEGPPRKLVGFEMLDRAIARHGYDVYFDGAKVGVVTSGTHTPFLKKAIGMAYVPIDRTVPGTEFDVEIRGRRARANVVPMPFYKRPK